MEYETKNSADPFYIKAIQLAGEHPEGNLTNQEAEVWIESLKPYFCEHSDFRKFVNLKQFIMDLTAEADRHKDEFKLDRVRGNVMIETALDLIQAGYGEQQILDDMELFFQAYKLRIRGNKSDKQ